MCSVQVQTGFEPELDAFEPKPIVQSKVHCIPWTEPQVRLSVLKNLKRTGLNWTSASLTLLSVLYPTIRTQSHFSLFNLTLPFSISLLSFQSHYLCINPTLSSLNYLLVVIYFYFILFLNLELNVQQANLLLRRTPGMLPNNLWRTYYYKRKGARFRSIKKPGRKATLWYESNSKRGGRNRNVSQLEWLFRELKRRAVNPRQDKVPDTTVSSPHLSRFLCI